MRSREEREEEHRNYRGDVFYDVWRSGGNPDRVDYDRVRDCYYDGVRHEDCASSELWRQRPAPQEEYPQEDYPPEEWPDEPIQEEPIEEEPPEPTP